MPGGLLVDIYEERSSKMGDQTTLAILLRRTLLANDDAILEFLTSKWGRVTIFAKKFIRSKKQSEIDFFRLLEIGIFQGRNSKSLKNAETRMIFSSFETDLRMNQIGWNWISLLLKTVPEEHTDEDFFKEVLSWFSGFNTENAEWCDVAFRFRILHHAGDCPRFDGVRENCFFDLQSKTLCCTETPFSLSLLNDTRQVCEFLRRSAPEVFHQKWENLPCDALLDTQLIVSEIEKNIH